MDEHTWRHWRRFVVPVVAILVIMFSLSGTGYAHAAQHPMSAPAHTTHQTRPDSTYNCTHNLNTGSGACYGQNYWTNCGGLCNGVETHPYVKWVGCNPTYCNSSNLWHTARSEWLVDTSDWAFQYCSGVCWIEAGWWQGCANSGGSGVVCSSDITRYYWADNGPCTGFNVHNGIAISPDYNTLDTINIQADGGNQGDHTTPPYCSNDKWVVTITSGGSGGGLSGLSQYNSMQAHEWQIGLEVYGNQGNAASADNMIDNNFWPQGGSWQYTTSSGNQLSISPASGYWAIAPAPGNYGGNFYNTCSCNYNG